MPRQRPPGQAAQAAAAIAAAREQGYGPGTKPGDRRPMARSLKAAGATLAEVGELFGVSAQQAYNLVHAREVRRVSEGEWGIIKAIRARDGCRDGELARKLGDWVADGGYFSCFL